MMPRSATADRLNTAADVQPQSRPCSTTISIGTMATTRVPTPHQSIATRLCVAGRCSTRRMTNSATAPSGTFMRKIQRQPAKPSSWSASAKNPPNTGPSTEATPHTPKKRA